METIDNMCSKSLVPTKFSSARFSEDDVMNTMYLGGRTPQEVLKALEIGVGYFLE